MCVNPLTVKKWCRRFYVVLFRVTESPLRLIVFRRPHFKHSSLYKHTHTARVHVRQGGLDDFPLTIHVCFHQTHTVLIKRALTHLMSGASVFSASVIPNSAAGVTDQRVLLFPFLPLSLYKVSVPPGTCSHPSHHRPAHL